MKIMVLIGLILFSSYSFANNDLLSLYHDKDYVKKVKEYIKVKKNLNIPIEIYQKNNPKIVSDLINEYISNHTKSLFHQNTLTLLNYRFRKDEIIFTTTAKYYSQKLQCKGEKLDFDIATVTNFGLRGYFIKIKKNTCEIEKKGSYNTAYYSVAYDQQSNILAYAIPGQHKIEIYNKSNFSLLYSIDGYSATTLEFNNGILYFAGYLKGTDWKKSSIYAYNISDKTIVNQYFNNLLADVRGLSFYNNLMAVSNGIYNKVYIFDLLKNKTIKTINGLTYPNGNFLIDNDNILVADEHSNFIRKINFSKMKEKFHSPTFQLKSPGGVFMITKGKYNQHYLISDTDNNRVILVEPISWTIIYEIKGLRSCLKAVPIYHKEVK